MTDKSITVIEKMLRLPDGFCSRLLAEDDWSFVVKSHALLESVLNLVVTKRINKLEGCQDDVLDIVSRLETSNPKTGKIAFLRAYGDFEPAQIRFVQSLSELRNRLVHRIENVYFSLQLLVASYDDRAFRAWCRSFEPYGDPIPEEEFSNIHDNPKQYVFDGLMEILSILHTSILAIELDDQGTALRWLDRWIKENPQPEN